MPVPRRENDSRRVVQSMKDHSDTMEALRRATAKPYDPNASYSASAPFTIVDGADVISKGEGLPYNTTVFKNNVAKKPNTRG